MAVIATCAAALALVAPSAASGPAGTSVRIAKNATLLSVTQVVVPVVVQCPAGITSAIDLFVSQPQPVGPNSPGIGVTALMCDGTHQTVDVTVTGGPFTTGNAFASAEVFSGFNAVSDSRVIKIG